MLDRRNFLASVTLLGTGAAGCSRSGRRPPSGVTTLTVATVNSAEMIVLQKLSRDFEAQNPGIRLDWVVL